MSDDLGVPDILPTPPPPASAVTARTRGGAESRASTRLTGKQVAVMEGLRAGKPLKTIAAELDVTVSTAATHQRRAQVKLRTRDRRLALAKWARCRRAYVS